MSPIRVDFYVLKEEQPESFWLFVCQLLEGAWSKGARVFVLCPSQKEAEYLDELLWTFKDDSFIPHNLQGEGPDSPPPIQIGWGETPKGFNEVLLNLSPVIPPFFSRFKHIMEIVRPDEEAKIISRNHFKEYRSYQCQIVTREISPETEASADRL